MLVIDTEGLDFVEDWFPGISFGVGFFGCLTMFCFGLVFPSSIEVLLMFVVYAIYTVGFWRYVFFSNTQRS